MNTLLELGYNLILIALLIIPLCIAAAICEYYIERRDK